MDSTNFYMTWGLDDTNNRISQMIDREGVEHLYDSMEVPMWNNHLEGKTFTTTACRGKSELVSVELKQEPKHICVIIWNYEIGFGLTAKETSCFFVAELPESGLLLYTVNNY